MSIQTKQDNVTQQPVSEKEVVAYLKQHPDFFEHHSMLLAELSIPHITGSAVSLVERQVAVLRSKNVNLQSQLDDFLQIASDNEKLSQQIYRLTLQLIQLESFGPLLDLLNHSLEEDFLVDAVSIHLLPNSGIPQLSKSPQAKIIEDGINFKALFGKVLEGGRPMVGRFNAQQREYLFADTAEKIGSMAVLPLAGDTKFGLLAIGSHDESRFHAGMGTVYLNQLATLTSKTINRLIA